MIVFLFTLDYEIYGDGHGSLRELIYEPAERLRQLFLRRDVRFVNFVEVAELQRIAEVGSDPAIDLVTRQLRLLHAEGFETGLHLHPQWCNAVYEQGRWELDYSEYNLCRLPRPRVERIVDQSLEYLRHVLDEPSFTPLSFRAGNWLIQPTQPAAGVLAERGVRIDSSVFKGGRQHRHDLDFRPALKNGDYWRFERDVNEPDENGALIEVPIHVRMVPSWKLLTKKRLAVQKRMTDTRHHDTYRLDRLRDFLRIRYPLKLDFCRLTLDELTKMVNRLVRKDRKDPSVLRPVVAIGHTKDIVDLASVESFLSYLAARSIPVATFSDFLVRLESDTEVCGRTPLS